MTTFFFNFDKMRKLWSLKSWSRSFWWSRSLGLVLEF